jgi:hypothetical protein
MVFYFVCSVSSFTRLTIISIPCTYRGNDVEKRILQSTVPESARDFVMKCQGLMRLNPPSLACARFVWDCNLFASGRVYKNYRVLFCLGGIPTSRSSFTFSIHPDHVFGRVSVSNITHRTKMKEECCFRLLVQLSEV